jgi:hypothetical protein
MREIFNVTVINRYGWLAKHRPATIWITVLGHTFGINRNGIVR